MKKSEIAFIGIGESGCKAVNNLFKEGYKALAIHDDMEIDDLELDCLQINLLQNHPHRENAAFVQNHIELLIEENINEIKQFLLQ